MSGVRPLRLLPRLGVGRGKNCGSVRDVGHPSGPGRGCDPGRDCCEVIRRCVYCLLRPGRHRCQRGGHIFSAFLIFPFLSLPVLSFPFLSLPFLLVLLPVVRFPVLLVRSGYCMTARERRKYTWYLATIWTKAQRAVEIVCSTCDRLGLSVCQVCRMDKVFTLLRVMPGLKTNVGRCLPYIFCHSLIQPR